MTQTLLFDVDGTLVDTLGDTVRAMNSLADCFRYEKIEHTAALRDVDWRQLPAHLGVSRFKSRRFWRSLNVALQASEGKPALFSAVPDALNVLKMSDANLAALTTTASENFSALSGYEKNFIYIDQENYSTHKKRCLEAFIRQHDLDKEAVVYFGDEIADMEAANSVGIKSVATTWGVNSAACLQASKPDFIIHQPQELLTVISQL